MNDIPRYAASMPLQTQFITNADGCGDHIFTQIKREGNVAIYSRVEASSGRPRGFEVFQIKTVKAGTVFAKGSKPTEKDYESYPGKSSFGKTSWFCVNEDRAIELFNEQFVEEQSSEESEAVVTNEQIAQETTDIPEGEFTQAQFATLNCMPPRGTVYNVLQHLIDKGLVKLSRREKIGPGKPTCLYSKV